MSEEFLNLVNLMSFVIGLQNLDLNLTQNDLEAQTKAINDLVDDEVKSALAEIHGHLEEQDKKIDKIMEVLNGRSI